MNNLSSQYLRVLQVLPALSEGGVERGTVDLAVALSQHGHGSFIASSGGTLLTELNRSELVKPKHGSSKSEYTPTQHFTLPVHSKRPWQVIRNAFRLNSLIKKHNINIIHVRSRAPAWSCLLASKLSKVPYIATFHGQYGHHSWLKRFYNSAMLRGKACIAVSNFIAEHIRTTYPRMKPCIRTIVRGIDPYEFNIRNCSPDKLIALQKNWKIDPSRPVILLAGRLTRIKGHALLLKAIHLTKRKDVQIIFVGSVSEKSLIYRELQLLIAELKLSDQVHFAGNCQRMSEAYALSDVLVSATTKPESFGRTIAEAQLIRCIAIAGDHGASRELISPRQSNLLYTPNDAQSLANCLSKLLSLSTEERFNIALTNEQYVAQNFRLSDMANATISFYKELVR